MSIESIFGLLGSLTAASLFFPQVLTSWRSKHTQDLAWTGIYLGMANGVLWTIYGLLSDDPFIYVTNIILFCGAFLLYLLKRKYK